MTTVATTSLSIAQRIIDTQTSFESLKVIDLDVSVENFFSRLFNNVGDALRNSLQEIRDLPAAERAIQDRNRFLALINTFSYMDIEALNVNVPEGLRVDYLTFAQLVSKAVEHTKDVDGEVLEPFRTYLSQIISNPSAKFDVRTDLLQKFRNRTKEREAIRRAILGCFDKTHVKIIPYGQAINRNADWDEVFNHVEANARLGIVDRKLFSKSVQDTVDLVSSVSTLVKGDTSFAKLNVKGIQAITELTTIAAEEVAFVASSFYFSSQLSANLSFAVKDLITKLR